MFGQQTTKRTLQWNATYGVVCVPVCNSISKEIGRVYEKLITMLLYIFYDEFCEDKARRNHHGIFMQSKAWENIQLASRWRTLGEIIEQSIYTDDTKQTNNK